MQRANGSTYLMASDDAGLYDPSGLFIPFYQAIHIDSYNLLDPTHPFRLSSATPSGEVYSRDHIPLNSMTPGGPFFDATNNPVTLGWLVEKKMDKYFHFNSANTGNYGGMDAWCTTQLPTGIINFNQNVDVSTLMPISDEQKWFLPQNGTNQQGQPIYIIPDGLYCNEVNDFSGGSNGDGTEPLHDINQFMSQILPCFEMATSDGGVGFDPIDCLVPDWYDNPLRHKINGLSMMSMDANVFSLSTDLTNGVSRVLEQSGNFQPGLYRFNIFLSNGLIAPYYIVLGKELRQNDIAVDIYPNSIINSTLKFGIEVNKNTPANILVQKLDGTTVYTESVSLMKNENILRQIPVSGSIPYHQLRVSIILPDGTVIQKTAMTE